MSNSRIFVRGLPPSIAEDDFRTHFSQLAPVTDAKLLPRRRIGYIGYKSDQDAARAVKYFNKSYIRTSRIAVEIADNRLLNQQLNRHTLASNSISISENDDEDDKTEDKNRPDGSQPSNPLKRKRSLLQDTGDAKLTEYLGLMKPFSKSTALDAHTSHLVSDLPLSASDTQELHPKPSNSPPSSDGPSPDLAIRDVPAAHASENDIAPMASDADWMRSRTSRLLGLNDEDQDDGQAPALASLAPDLSNSSVRPSTQPDSEIQVPFPVAKDDSGGNDAMVRQNRRLFVRNLAYEVTESDMEEQFRRFGTLEEVTLPRDPRTGQAKGFGFVQYSSPDAAAQAFQACDGTIFQGRLLHILPAAAKRENQIDEYTLSKLPMKKQRKIQKKSEASSATFSWNSLYMNANAVLSSISDRLGVSKSEILDPSSTDASVKLAQAETHVLQETKNYFSTNGIDLDAFKHHDRSETAVLVKNFPYGTTMTDLRQLFSAHGDVSKILMPPSGTIAIVEFELPMQAKSAFGALAYSKYRDSILFLEKAPKGLFKGKSVKSDPDQNAGDPKVNPEELLEPEQNELLLDTSTLYVRNLNFATTNEVFKEAFQALDGFLSARVKTKTNPNNPGESLSMGFGFVEFKSASQARAALVAMNGFNLEGHRLIIKASHKGNDAAQERKIQDELRRKRAKQSKLVIKNLPFEASKKDVRNLFKSYGQLRAVRAPKKFDNSRKGYAFAEFSTPREAENALESLKNTHLLGRRLVIDYAADDVDDPELEIAKMQKKISKESDTIAMQKLASGSERRKVDIAGSGIEMGDGT